MRENMSLQNIEQNKKYALFLCSVPWIGGHTVEKLLNCFGDLRSIFEGSRNDLEKILSAGRLQCFLDMREQWDIDAKYEELNQKGIHFVTIEEAEYPMRLKNIPDAPYGIFYIGGLPSDERISVAVIGARDCSQYGSYVASELGRKLGEAGVQVISGMARGIDGISQIEAMRAGGVSYAVLGSGVDVCYPEQNRHIYEMLRECGGIISTYPPGTVAAPRNFPPRNRIVSGLADAVVVIEARLKSGTLITVDMALEQGKDVYAAPGRVTDRLSDGCNRLIRQGAAVFLSPEDFLEELTESHRMQGAQLCRERAKRAVGGIGRGGNVSKDNVGNDKVDLSGLSVQLREVAEALDFTPQDIGTICGRLRNKRSVAEVSAQLMQLALMGIARQVSAGQFALEKLI